MCIFNNYGYCQEKATSTINENDLKAHLKFIASNQLKGRKLGSPELDITAQYIASNLEKMNINPIKYNESYFKNIDFINIKPDNKNSFIKIKSNEIETRISGDSLLSMFPHPKNIETEEFVVFTGYGLIDSVSKYNDFENVDVKDKIIMIMSRSPEKVMSNKLSNEPFLYEFEYEKISNAYKNGAKAILWVLDPLNKFDKLSDLEELNEYANQSIYLKKNIETVFPIDFIIISQQTANLILSSSGNSLSDLQNKINKNNKSASFEIKNSKIIFQIKRTIEDFKSPNVIGYIEGRDSVLKDEYIIYTAHYDHLGVDNKGNVYNGADDNGSGTVALLELAEAFMSLPEKPKRTIVLAWMTAEEKGGIGSSFYVDNPVFPIENTIACINLDVIGRVKTSKPKHKWVDVRSKDSLFVISGDLSRQLIDINTQVCEDLNLIPDYSDKYRLNYSDQYFFHKKGIPVLFYHTGFSEDYHLISDEIEKIDFLKMKRITQLAFLVGLEIANNKKRLEIDKPK
jgi:hypothetical protein